MRLEVDTVSNRQMERWTGRLEEGVLKDRDGDAEMVFLRSNEGELPLSPHAWYCFQSLPPPGRAEGAALCRPPISRGKTKITAAVSEAEKLVAAGAREPRGEARLLGGLPREEVARCEFPGTAAHAAAKGPRSSLPCDFVPVAAGRVSGNISSSALTGSRGEGNRASLAHLAFPPTPGGV